MPASLLALLLTFSLLFQALPGRLAPAMQSPGVQVLDADAQYTFGSELTLSARIASPTPIQEVLLYILAEGKDTRVEPVTVSAGGQLRHVVDLQANRLRPFARIYYWYQVTAEGFPAFTSPSFWFDYTDTRFDWQTQANTAFRVHWTAGGADLAQDALNTAEDAVGAIQSLLPVPFPAEPIDIYVYPSAKDLQGALELSGQALVAGHANPDLGVVLVSVPPGPEQRLDLQQQLPHELAHVLLFLRAPASYNRLPAWFVEGFASLSELYPNPDYDYALAQAKKQQGLLPVAGLCQSFPPDASGAFLAYAQSASFVKYLHRTYGSTGLDRLAQAFADGMGCAEGTAAALGKPLTELDQDWREGALGVNAGQAAARNLAPYLALFGLLIIVPAAPLLLSRRAARRKAATVAADSSVARG